MSLPDCQDRVFGFLYALEPSKAGWNVPQGHEKASVVHTTNQSVVFLSGGYAYKLFKAIERHRDNRTVAARLENAQLEIEANQHLAAELYIGILAIVENEDGLLCFAELGEEGGLPVLDYVVKMHRFAEHELLYTRLIENRLTAEDMFDLGRRVAMYHTSQPPIDQAGFPNGFDAFYRDFARTVEYFSVKIPKTEDQTRLINMRAMAQDAIRQAKGDFLARTGKRCIIHGDLDFGNITTFGGKIMPFDAQVLRGQRAEDPAKDLAFMLAPLYVRSRPDLATALINGYQEVARDATLMFVLSHWVAYAAIVRGGSWYSRAAITSNRDESTFLQTNANLFFTLAKALFEGRLKVCA